MEVVSRGHRGTFVTSLDLAQLWQFSAMPPMHVLLPPPGPVEAQCIAHALAERMERIGASITVGFLGGAQARDAAVSDGTADIAVMSHGAASTLRRKNRISLKLGPGTYYRPGSLVVVTRQSAGPVRRIGIDPHSDDHQRLTRAEFAAGGGEFVETEFTAIPRAVLEGTIDAGVWHTVQSLIPLDLAGLAIAPLSTVAAQRLAAEISGAVLIAEADSVPGAVLGNVDVSALRDVWTRAIDTSLPELQARMRVRLTR